MLPAGDKNEVETFMELMKKWLKLSNITGRKIKTAQGSLLQVCFPLS
jgi:hypothetical protein